MSKVIETSNALPLSQVSGSGFGRDLLTEVLRNGSRELLARAVEQEVREWLADRANLTDERCRQLVVRNGHLPERTIPALRPPTTDDHRWISATLNSIKLCVRNVNRHAKNIPLRIQERIHDFVPIDFAQGRAHQVREECRLIRDGIEFVNQLTQFVGEQIAGGLRSRPYSDANARRFPDSVGRLNHKLSAPLGYLAVVREPPIYAPRLIVRKAVVGLVKSFERKAA